MEEVQKQELETPKENPEEEQELLKEPVSDEVRLSIIEKYGLDEEANEELITKLVEENLESRKKLSTAIKQKIGWRTKATQTEKKPEEKPQPPVKVETDLDKVIDQKLEERELQSLDISDELKREIKTYAKAGGLTIKQALQSDYFKYLKGQEEAKLKVEEATIGGKRRAPSRQEFDLDSPPTPDMSTKEGRGEWENWKKFLKSKS